MRQLYRTLFEVKILHEYYLTNPDNTSVFQSATQTQRLAWLTDRFTKDQPALTNDVQFVLPAAMAELFKNRRMVLISSYSGFQVAIQVTESPAGGTPAYAPLVPLEAGLNMVILIQQSGGRFGLLTNGRLRRPVQSLYYFSNETVTTAKTPPVLSSAIPAQVLSGYTYEQGELSDNGTSICSCYYDGTTRVLPAIDGNGFANENDRLIVGTEFDYTFDPSDGVTQAQFTLKDQGGAVIRTVNASNQQGTLDTVTLNFSDLAGAALNPLVTLPAAGASDPILYSLEVTGDGGYTRTLNLIFYDQPSELLSTWGVVQVQLAVSNASFNLLDTNGNLVTPVLAAPDSTNSPYPVFEIRCKSRYTFWRYYSDNPSLSLNTPTGTLTSFLKAASPALTTKTPVPATYLPYFFTTDPNDPTPTYTYLPNPDPDTVIEMDGNQLFSNIRIPQSALFPTSQI